MPQFVTLQNHVKVRFCYSLSSSHLQPWRAVLRLEKVRIAERMAIEHFSAGAVLVKQGEPASKFYVIEVYPYTLR